MGLPFFSFSLGRLWGDFFILLLLSVCVPISSPLSFLFHDVPFFSVYASVSSGAVVLFYRAKFVEPGPCLCLSLSGRLHLISVFLLFFPVSASSISTDSFSPLAQFHPSFLPIVFSTASFLPAFQSLWSEASVQLHFPYYTPPFYCLLCAFCHLRSPSLLKSVHTWSLSSFWFPEWMVIFALFLVGIRWVCVYQLSFTLS